MAIKRIYLTHEKDFTNYTISQDINVSVYAEHNDGTISNITGDSDAQIFSLDEDFCFLKAKTVDKYTFYFKKEGSAIIKAIYKDPTGKKFFASKQFLGHGTFFKDNYLKYFFSSFDSDKISSNAFVKAILDTLMEMLDILYAHNEDLKVIGNFKEGKIKFIELLSQNVGLEKIDYTDTNTEYDQSSNEIWKELVSNILDLLSIRGTRLAYELFFGALGYNIDIQEFWYDEDGNLIEINSYDDSASTFFAYREDGSLIDSPPIPRPDPRRFRNSTTSNFINSKSNLIRVNISESKNESFAIAPSNFSQEKKRIISQYLEFLRPVHIQYIKEAIGGLNLLDEYTQLEDEIIYGQITTEELSDTVFDFFGNISSVYEQFVVGSIKNIITEFASLNRWDSGFKYDTTVYWDFKSFLNEEFSAEVI